MRRWLIRIGIGLLVLVLLLAGLAAWLVGTTSTDSPSTWTRSTMCFESTSAGQ